MNLLRLVAAVLLLPLVFAYLGAALLAVWVGLRDQQKRRHSQFRDSILPSNPSSPSRAKSRRQ